MFWKLFKAIFERLVKQVALKLLFWENYKKRHDKLCGNDNNSIDNIYIYIFNNKKTSHKKFNKESNNNNNNNILIKIIIIIIIIFFSKKMVLFVRDIY